MIRNVFISMFIYFQRRAETVPSKMPVKNSKYIYSYKTTILNVHAYVYYTLTTEEKTILYNLYKWCLIIMKFR